MCITPSHLIRLFISKKRDARAFFLSALEHVVCLGQLSRLSQVNNYSPRANVFPAVVANFGKAMYGSLEGSTQDTWDGFFSWPRVDLVRLLRRAYSRPFGLHPSSLSKSAGFVFLSGKASLVSISAAILFLRSWHVYFPLEFKFCGKGAWRRRWHLVSPTLYMIIV